VKLNHLDLFSGIGGFSLGLERTGGFRTIGFCETDAYCTKVLQKNFPGIPIHGDIRELKGTDFGAVDIITGGYPCQPFSVAGRQKGVEDPRHLWPEMFRVVQESRPTWVIGENVAGHIKLGLDSVLKDLESEGYRTRTFSVSASSVGANHQRERIWIVAHSECNEHQHTLKKVNGKEKEVPGKHWKENGSARKSVGADPIRETDNTDVANARQSNGGIEPSGNTESPGRGASEKAERSADANKAARSSERAEAMADSESISGDEREYRNHSQEKQEKRNVRGQSGHVADTLKGHVQAGRERRREIRQGHQEEGFSDNASSGSKAMADTDKKGIFSATASRNNGKDKTQSPDEHAWGCRSVSGGEILQGNWSVEPDVGRVAHGIPNRVDRLKSLGNSLIPHIPYYIGQSIIATYEDNDTV